MTVTEQEKVIQEAEAMLAGWDKAQLIAYIPDLYEKMQGDTMKSQFAALCISRAGELRCKTEVRKLFDTLQKEQKLAALRELRRQVIPDDMLPLDYDSNGKPRKTLDNFLNIMEFDPYYSGVRYNVLTQSAEVQQFDSKGNFTGCKAWNSTEDSKSRHHIESTYFGLYDVPRHDDALKIFFERKQYNPVTDLLDSLPEWDGVERCSEFLWGYMGADQSPYTYAASRILFDSAVARAYNPGCKVDCSIVLIGAQGGGKSTIIRYLALNDSYYGEVNTADGSPRSVEQLFGKWILEMPELAAMKRAKEIESLKAYMTRQFDRYRTPYDKRPVDFPRRCIMIGTGNDPEFLTDTTGNRRYLPVQTQPDGRYIYEHETDIRDHILLCYAEAKYHLDHDDLLLTMPEDLIKETVKRQRAAVIEDVRLGYIRQYIEEMEIGDITCSIDIWKAALLNEPQDFNKGEQRFVNASLRQFKCLQDIGRTYIRPGEQQRCFKKISKYDPDDE